MTTTDDPLPGLIEGTHHAQADVRLKSIKSLAKLGGLARDALPSLNEALNDSDPKVREAAAQAIGQLGIDAIPTLSKMLRHPDKYVRRHAVWALGKVGPAALGLLHDLCQLLKDADARTATGAAQAIGVLGEAASTAVPNLAEAMRGTNIVLCRIAAKALSQIGRPALPTLIQHLKHSDPFVRGEAAVALGWLGPIAASSVNSLIELMRNCGNKRSRRAQQFTSQTPPTGVTSNSLESTDEATYINAIVALGRIGPDAMTALPFLQDAQFDSSEPVRRAVEIAIRQVQGL